MEKRFGLLGLVVGVVCRKWSGYWGGLEKVVGVVGVNGLRGWGLLGGLEKVVGVVGVNCIKGCGLFGWFGESGWDCWGDLYMGVGVVWRTVASCALR